MKLAEDKVLRILARKGAKVITYDDFRQLRPPGEVGGYWLYPLKNILLRKGWKLHQARQKASWRNCGFRGSKLTSIKPSSFLPNFQLQADRL